MHFFQSIVTGALVLAATVAAQVQFVSAPSNVEEATPVTFTWTGASGPVTINLMEGSTLITTVVSSASGTSYTWTAPANLVSNTDYSWTITDGSSTDTFNNVVLNASLEPGSTSTITSAPVVPTPATSTIVPPPITTVPPPPANTSIPPTGSMGVASSSFNLVFLTSLATLVGAFAMFL